MEENIKKGNNLSAEELTRCNQIITTLWNYYSERIVGQKTLGMSLLITLITNRAYTPRISTRSCKDYLCKSNNRSGIRQIFKNTMYSRSTSKRYNRNTDL